VPTDLMISCQTNVVFDNCDREAPTHLIEIQYENKVFHADNSNISGFGFVLLLGSIMC
jgi:hypothetical protein